MQRSFFTDPSSFVGCMVPTSFRSTTRGPAGAASSALLGGSGAHERPEPTGTRNHLNVPETRFLQQVLDLWGIVQREAVLRVREFSRCSPGIEAYDEPATRT